MGQKRILVVDDEAVLRELLADILAREGHQVDTACDGLAGCGKTGLLRPGQDDSSATMRITLPQEVRMRGDDRQQGAMYSYISPEARVPHDHPLRAIRGLVDDVLRELSPRFEGLYARVGRPSIAPEQLRAQFFQFRPRKRLW